MKRLALVTAIALGLGQLPLAAADWPRFRGPRGDGISAEKLELLPKPRRLWSKDVGSGNASVVVSAGKAYTVGFQRARNSVVLSCLDAKTGRVVWESKIDSGGSNSSPVVVGERIYVLCHHGKPVLRCLRTTDGRELWATELTGPTGERSYGHTGSPLPWRDLIILNVGTGAAVDQKTGKIVWQHPGLPGLATPVLYTDAKSKQPGVLIFAGRKLVARDARSGREHWSLPWKTDIAVNAADPIYHSGRVFITTTYGKHGALFDVSTGRPEQLWKLPGSAFSSGIRWKDHLFCFASSRFVCLDFHTGQRKWQHHGVGKGSAILAGDKLIVLSDRGRLWIARRSTAGFRPVVEEQIHQRTTWTPPAFADKRLYIRSKEGLVVCLQIGQ